LCAISYVRIFVFWGRYAFISYVCLIARNHHLEQKYAIWNKFIYSGAFLWTAAAV
jgi:hypothetical protein